MLTELVAAVAFAVAAGAFWLTAGMPSPGVSGWWLTLLCAVFVRVGFDIGEGHSRPVVLAVVPMLLLAPAASGPAAGGRGALRRLCARPRARTPARPARADAVRRRVVRARARVAVRATRRTPSGRAGRRCSSPRRSSCSRVTDFVASGLRLSVGLGVDPRDDLRAYAWTYFVDFLLAPIGLLVAWAADEFPASPAALLPLAGLLALFAHERRGRMENAVALQQLAEESRDRLQSIVQHASDLILILDAGGRLRTVTGSTDAFGAGSGDLLLDRVHPEDAGGVAVFLAAVADKPHGESAEAEWRMVDVDGAFRHVSAVATNLIADPRIDGLVLTVRDDDARKRFEQQLRHRAFHDELTGLANRALFYDRTEHALSRGARGDAEVAVLFVDLDDFKPVNDRLGHAAGDQLLQLVAKRLVACVRSADTVARLGGDEFGILLEGADVGHAVEAAERVLAALETRFDLPSEALRVSASVGVAVSREGVRDVEELLRAADRAMYEAKRGGKHRLAVHDPAAPVVAADGSLRLFMSSEAQRAEIVAAARGPGRADDGLPARARPAHGARRRLRGAGALQPHAGALAGQVVRAGAPLRARRGARGARAGRGAGGRRTARRARG